MLTQPSSILAALAHCNADRGAGVRKRGPFEPEGQFYEDIAGSYTAPISGTDSGHTLDVVMTLTVTQFGGALSGTYSQHRYVGRGVRHRHGHSDGLSGGVLDPDVEIVFRSGLCATVQTRFVGSMSA